jgi:hypothetical protein
MPSTNEDSEVRKTGTIDPFVSQGAGGEDENVGALRKSAVEDHSAQDSAPGAHFAPEDRGSTLVSGSDGEATKGRDQVHPRAESESKGTAAFARRSARESAEASLLNDDEASGLRERWTECQQRFVDEPRDAVRSADELVAEVMEKVASEFANTRESLEQQWDRGDRVSTEDLRLAMQRYREFFNRLLAA